MSDQEQPRFGPPDQWQPPASPASGSRPPGSDHWGPPSAQPQVQPQNPFDPPASPYQAQNPAQPGWPNAFEAGTNPTPPASPRNRPLLIAVVAGAVALVLVLVGGAFALMRSSSPAKAADQPTSTSTSSQSALPQPVLTGPSDSVTLPANPQVSASPTTTAPPKVTTTKTVNTTRATFRLPSDWISFKGKAGNGWTDGNGFNANAYGQAFGRYLLQTKHLNPARRTATVNATLRSLNRASQKTLLNYHSGGEVSCASAFRYTTKPHVVPHGNLLVFTSNYACKDAKGAGISGSELVGMDAKGYWHNFDLRAKDAFWKSQQPALRAILGSFNAR